MSEKPKRRPIGIPPYYWTNPPERMKRPTEGFANKKQKEFYLLVTTFKVAKVVAALALALLIVGMI